MNTVKLIDGREVSTYSEEWRAECEVRAVCLMPTLHERRSFMAKVQEKRGKAAHDELQLRVLDMWDHLRAIAKGNDAA